MPPHSFTLLLHSRVDVCLAFVLCDLNAGAVFLAFAVEANTAPITCRQQNDRKKGSGSDDGFHVFALSHSNAVRGPTTAQQITPPPKLVTYFWFALVPTSDITATLSFGALCQKQSSPLRLYRSRRDLSAALIASGLSGCAIASASLSHSAAILRLTARSSRALVAGIKFSA